MLVLDIKAVNLKLPADLKQAVKIAAAREGVTMQDFMHNGIQAAVDAVQARLGADMAEHRNTALSKAQAAHRAQTGGVSSY